MSVAKTNAVVITMTPSDHLAPPQIRIGVKTAYLDSESNPNKERYVFAYTVTIENLGDTSTQLINRHWIIIDGNGKEQEVKGEGVVGEQPVINPGTGYQYTSGTMLETPVGIMQGSYEMRDADGHMFNAEIKPFTLAIPRVLH